MLLSVLILFNASLQSQTHFGWLEGTWKQNEKSVYEVWTKGSGEILLEGVSYKISTKGDTVITEKISLVQEGDRYYYVPDVAGDQGPIRFSITQINETGFIAENPAHDFPKKIAYTYSKKNNQLTATISGDGKSIGFNFEKILK